MHVLIIPTEEIYNPAVPLDGIFQWQQALALQKSGVKVGFLSVQRMTGRKFFRCSFACDSEIINDISIHRRYSRNPIPERFQNPLDYINKFKSLGCELYDEYVNKNGKPDIVHAHNFRSAGFVAQGIFELTGMPYFVTEHSSEYLQGTYSKPLIPFIRKCALSAAGVSAVSNVLKLKIESLLEIEDVFVLHNIVDPSISEIARRNTFERDESKFVFLNIASLIEVKNHSLLLISFSQKFKGKNAQLRIGGGGPLKIQLSKQAAELGISNQVIFLGHLSRDEVVRELLTASAFVLTSKFETFGVVLIEALMCGLPVISTDCGGPSDIICNDTGFIVASNDPLGFANAMQILVEKMSCFDRKYISEKTYVKFGEASFLKKIMLFYKMSSQT